MKSSQIRLEIGVIVTDLKSFKECGEEYLRIGVKWDISSRAGHLPCCTEALMMEQSGVESSMANSWFNFIGNSVGVMDLFKLKLLSFLVTFF